MFDREETGILDRLEYYLFRAAITNFLAERDHDTPLVNYRFNVIFKMYDQNSDSVLNKSELFRMVQVRQRSSEHTIR